jgi:solute carrier family 36 (proton-coupled amino acid transporter)
MPKNFVNGGYAFSAFSLLCSLIMTLFCAKLLIETRAKVGGSFSEIGERTWGRTGKILVDVTLFFSQISFVTAYIYFISKNMMNIIHEAQHKSNPDAPYVSKWYFGAACFLIYVPLCLVRKIDKLAATHLFGDIMIIFTIGVIFVYGGLAI